MGQLRVLIIFLFSLCLCYFGVESKTQKKVTDKVRGRASSCTFTFLFSNIPLKKCAFGTSYKVFSIFGSKGSWYTGLKTCGIYRMELASGSDTEIRRIAESVKKLPNYSGGKGELGDTIWLGVHALSQTMNPGLISDNEWSDPGGFSITNIFSGMWYNNTRKRVAVNSGKGLQIESCIELVVSSAKVRAADCFKEQRFACVKRYVGA